ncbi:hypothetical protein ACKKBG_A25445 [Auxenochlorella protothecoides x Auxenochlorella symbiontica]
MLDDEDWGFGEFQSAPGGEPGPSTDDGRSDPSWSQPRRGMKGIGSEDALQPGMEVLYLGRDGGELPAQVVSVDRSVLPYSYGILLGGNYRETEASRLRVAGDGAGSQEVYPQTLIPSGLSHGGVEGWCSPEAAVELRTESADFSFGEWTGLEVSTVLVPTEATAMHAGALDAMGPPSAPVAAANHDWSEPLPEDLFGGAAVDEAEAASRELDPLRTDLASDTLQVEPRGFDPRVDSSWPESGAARPSVTSAEHPLPQAAPREEEHPASTPPPACAEAPASDAPVAPWQPLVRDAELGQESAPPVPHPPDADWGAADAWVAWVSPDPESAEEGPEPGCRETRHPFEPTTPPLEASHASPTAEDAGRGREQGLKPTQSLGAAVVATASDSLGAQAEDGTASPRPVHEEIGRPYFPAEQDQVMTAPTAPPALSRETGTQPRVAEYGVAWCELLQACAQLLSEAAPALASLSAPGVALAAELEARWRRQLAALGRVYCASRLVAAAASHHRLLGLVQGMQAADAACRAAWGGEGAGLGGAVTLADPDFAASLSDVCNLPHRLAGCDAEELATGLEWSAGLEGWTLLPARLMPASLRQNELALGMAQDPRPCLVLLTNLWGYHVSRELPLLD